MQLLTEYKAEAFLEKEGLTVVERRLCKSEPEALAAAEDYGFPVVLKLASEKLLHKTEFKAVRLNVTKEEFHQAYSYLHNLPLEKEGIIVQKFVEGNYLLVGLKNDPTFGHVLAVGLGGIYTEILKDVSFRITPVEKRDIKEMLEELKGYTILEGFRGERANLRLIYEVLLKISKLSEKYPTIEELDINPLIVNEKEATIVDARIVFN